MSDQASPYLISSKRLLQMAGKLQVGIDCCLAKRSLVEVRAFLGKTNLSTIEGFVKQVDSRAARA